MNKLDTSPTMLSADPASPAASVWYQRRRLQVGAAILGVMGFLLGLTFVVPVGVLANVVPGTSMIDQSPVVLRPGQARGVADRVSVSASHVFEAEGNILFTTVSVDDEISIFEWLMAKRDPRQEIFPHDLVFGTRSVTETRERNLQMMQVSKDTAVLVAFQHLGLDVIDETGINFAEVMSDGPSAGRLEVGEVIVAIDGAPITDFESLQLAIDILEPGDVVRFTLEDNSTFERRDELITMGNHPDEPERAFIGIGNVGIRATQADLPFDVSIDSGQIGGPSAGLAFTLTILDLLTPGELTGGHRVAVTGTISLDESVGDVGGAEQKAVGARRAGARVFIVPEAEAEAARLGAGDMEVVGVSTLSEALDVLARLGGDTEGLELPA